MSLVLRAGEIAPARVFGPFEPPDVGAYAVASADDNPLHTDPAIAARAGLLRPPIHGMLIMGCFEPFLRGWLADVQVIKLSGKFIRPVLVGESFEISGKVVQVAAAGEAVVRLMVKRAGDLVCLAEVFIRP